MVTEATASKQSSRYPSFKEWRHFLDEAVASMSEADARFLETAVNNFRNKEWPEIQHALRKRYRIGVYPNCEPHWVSPGKAIYWRQVQGISRSNSDSAPAWTGTPPLPSNNAAQVHHYLQKGFHLRPPQNGVEVTYEVVESADSPEAAPEREPRPFKCERHGTSQYLFATWKAYIAHCNRFYEAPEAAIPDEVVSRLSSFPYACFQHNMGIKNKRLATHHVREYTKRPGMGHASVEQMRVKSNANNNSTDNRLTNANNQNNKKEQN